MRQIRIGSYIFKAYWKVQAVGLDLPEVMVDLRLLEVMV